MNVSLPYTPTINQSTVGMQARVVGMPPADGNMSNYTVWNVESLHMEMFGGQYPARPMLDFNLDDRYEWGGVMLVLVHGDGKTGLPTPKSA